MRKDVWVVLNAVSGQAVRIFRTQKAAAEFEGYVLKIPYFTAVSEIRHQLWLRCRGECELCAASITESSGHMHEQKHRGKGGEISMENSVFICPICHRRAHADRNPHFSSSKPPLSGGFVTDNIKDGETVCMNGARPFDCRMCMIRARGKDES
jgi:hypothetical protein